VNRRDFLQGAAASSLLAACARRVAAPCATAPAPAMSAAPSRGIRFDPAAPTLFLSAHCDDAPVEAWHLLSTSKPVQLAIAFMAVPPAGTMGHDDQRGDFDAAAYIRERQAEERAAVAPLGIEPVFLSGLDMPYRDGEVPSLGVLAGELAQRVPAASRIVCPLGIGIRFRVGTPTYSHVDHKLARDIADSFPSIPKVYYGENYAVSSKTSDYHELEALVRAYPHWRVERVTLTPDELVAKRAAFDKYKTQVGPILSAIPDMLSPSLFGTEIYCYPGG
jgi:LmbE family N-acetylglucosaminyl deacetylase